MAITPIQFRTIDPFADYLSNSTNKLTRIISRGSNCLHGPHDIDVTISDSTTVIIATGFCFKDDVYIQLGSTSTLDFTDNNSYFESPSLGWVYPEDGYYYIALNYTYSKIKPAPIATLGILRPYELGLIFDDKYIFLKAVNVVGGIITEVFNFDLGTGAKRNYSQTFVGLENTLPIFNQTTDEGRLILNLAEDEFYFGTNQAWVNFNTSHVVINTETDTVDPLEVGDIIYVNDITGKLGKALATSFDTLARAVVISYGPATGGVTGKMSLFGRVQQVKIEDGVTILEGEKLYLSNTDSGRITNVSPPSFQQFIGTAISNGVDSSGVNICEVWFTPNLKASGGGSGGNFEDTMWMMMLDKSTYLDAYYDLFSSPDTVVLSDPPPSYNFASSYYYGENGDYFITPELISDSTSILYRFYNYIDTDETFPFKVEYTIDDGTSYTEIVNSISTQILSGFTTLKLKVTWLGSGIIYSYGVLYNESMYQALSDTRMLEVWVSSANHSAPFDLVVPNNGVFTNDTKSLEVYLNGVRLSYYNSITNPNGHYIELNEYSIRLLNNIYIDDIVMFVEHYGYIDSSVENYGRVSSIISGSITTGNANTVDGIHANAIATENNLFPLGANKNLSLPTPTSGVHHTINGVEIATVDSTVANSITATQLSDSTNIINIKIIDIGDWNMDSDSIIQFPHGLGSGKIRNISVSIRQDSPSNAVVDINYFDHNTPGTSPQGITWNDTYITIYRSTGANFDNTAYDSTSYNRGWATVTYVD